MEQLIRNILECIHAFTIRLVHIIHAMQSQLCIQDMRYEFRMYWNQERKLPVKIRAILLPIHQRLLQRLHIC